MILGKEELKGSRKGQKCQRAWQVAGFGFLGHWVELPEPQFAHLSSGDSICLAYLRGWLCLIGTCPSVPCP